ncbi:unnamed protein product [Mycena citricolor]|uniref:FAD-binding domain-containing protein n=1 Tax=Mycena citricolor TaxID=2018698 RepID=A0AAD2JXR9_9AGAR|nr:unnamed protein product [Mycena citricolor]
MVACSRLTRLIVTRAYFFRLRHVVWLLATPFFLPLPHETMDAFDFVIVGGSIAGLTAAYALRQAGHRVLVLERRERDAVMEGGLRVPPNMTCLLKTLPQGPELLEAYGWRCSAITFINCESQQTIGRLQLIEEVMTDLGCYYYMVPYEKLYNFLRDLCESSGAQIRFQTDIVAIRLGRNAKPTVVTSTGESIKADILVGADGRASIVRDALLELNLDADSADESDFDDCRSEGSTLSLPPDLHEIVGGTCCINISAVQDQPDLMEIANSTEFTYWPGTDLFVSGHRCGPDLFVVSIVWTNGLHTEDTDSDWRPEPLILNDRDAESFRLQDARLKRLVSYATTCHRTIQQIPKIPRVTDPNTRVIIIGDAAHSTPIHCSHNSSLAVEDGFALGRIFSHIKCKTQIPFFLSAFHQIRHKRGLAVEAAELAGIAASTFGPGPARDARDKQLALMSSANGNGEVEDEVVAAVWADYLMQFNYNAIEAVEDWWLTWGKLNKDC